MRLSWGPPAREPWFQFSHKPGVTQRALNVTQRALNVTQRALRVIPTQRARRRGSVQLRAVARAEHDAEAVWNEGLVSTLYRAGKIPALMAAVAKGRTLGYGSFDGQTYAKGFVLNSDTYLYYIKVSGCMHATAREREWRSRLRRWTRLVGCESGEWGFGWAMSSRGCSATPAQSLSHDCSPCRGATRTPRTCGRCASFQGPFCTAKPESFPIPSKRITVRQLTVDP